MTTDNLTIDEQADAREVRNLIGTPPEQLAQQADRDIAMLRFVMSDLWSDFRPHASRMVLHENLALLQCESERLQKLIQTVQKYGQPSDAQR